MRGIHMRGVDAKGEEEEERFALVGLLANWIGDFLSRGKARAKEK